MFGARYSVQETGIEVWPTIILHEIHSQLASECPNEKIVDSAWYWPSFSEIASPELHQKLSIEGKYFFDKAIVSVDGYGMPGAGSVVITVYDETRLPRSKLDSILKRAHENGWEAFKRSIGAREVPAEPKVDLAMAA